MKSVSRYGDILPLELKFFLVFAHFFCFITLIFPKYKPGIKILGEGDGKEGLTTPSWDSVEIAFAVGTFPTNGRRDHFSRGQNKVFQARSETRT